MSRLRQPLPEYGTLIRWTVQEVINWLSENKLDCSRCFRDGGVDGNKLVNITEIDLNNIRCPKKYIREILNQVDRVSRPGAPARTGGGGYGNRSNQRQVPFNEAHHHQDDRDASDDDAWSDNEFDSDYDDDDNNNGDSYNKPIENNPVAPPRPNRRDVQLPASSRPHRQLPARPEPEPEEEEFYQEPDEVSGPPLPSARDRLPPPVPDSRGRPTPPNARGRPQPPDVRGRPPAPVPDLDGPNEDYEDPDASIKVAHFHGGPLPTPPLQVNKQVNKQVPIAQRKPPALPTDSSDSDTDSVEEYEDPDSTVVIKPPPIPTGPRRPLPPPAEPEEEYEEPDAMVAKKPPKKSQGQRKPPPPPVSSVPPSRSVRNRAPVEEELPSYEMPEEESAPPPPVPRNVPRNAPRNSPRNAPRKKAHEPIVVQEETYEIPDETDSAPPKPAPQKFNKQDEEEEFYEVPDTDDTEDQDDYLDMEQEISTPPSMPVPSAKSKPDRGPRRGAMPLPGEPKSQGRKTSDDRKAPVEPPVEDEEIKVPQMKKKVGVPVFPVSNGVKEPAQHSPAQQSPRQGRSLPPPPAVTPERREPEKPHAAKSTTPQKAELTESDLLRQKWYHGNIKRIDAEIKLKQLSIDGMYLIRKSSQGSDQPYTLQIFFHGKCYNLPIRRRSDNLLAVGKEEKEGEKAFSSLLDLVNMFKQNILVLSGGAETKLVKSLPKS